MQQGIDQLSEQCIAILMLCICAWGITAIASAQPPVARGATAVQQAEPVQAARPDTSEALRRLGVVWEVPKDFQQARADLLQMHRLGVTAVRTGVIEDEALLTMADTLGLALYQDLPVRALSAVSLVDSLGTALQILDGVLTRARLHPSARHFGLAQNSATFDPAACTYFSELAAYVRDQGPPNSQAYYVTPFVAGRDQCAPMVDEVLLDLRGLSAPVERVASWVEAMRGNPAEIGVGALGTWVEKDASEGVHVPHSPEAQARYLEVHLAGLQAGTEAPYPGALFVYRWRDRAAGADDGLLERAYGLLAADDTPRPALDVVEGFFTQRQTVFAFAAQESGPQTTPWPIFVGWGLALILGIAYARQPQFRRTLSRYFQAHGFYRDSLRDGRETVPEATTLLLVSAVAGSAMLGIVGGQVAASTRTAEFVVAALPDRMGELATLLLAEPWSIGVVLGVACLVGIFLWATVLVLASKTWKPLSTEQALMLLAWPCWSSVLVLVAAMVGYALPADIQANYMAWVVAASVGIALAVVVRVSIDYSAITKIPVWAAAVLSLFSPLGLLAGAMLVLLLYGLPFELVWALGAHT